LLLTTASPVSPTLRSDILRSLSSGHDTGGCGFKTEMVNQLPHQPQSPPILDKKASFHISTSPSSGKRVQPLGSALIEVSLSLPMHYKTVQVLTDELLMHGIRANDHILYESISRAQYTSKKLLLMVLNKQQVVLGYVRPLSEERVTIRYANSKKMKMNYPVCLLTVLGKYKGTIRLNNQGEERP